MRKRTASPSSSTTLTVLSLPRQTIDPLTAPFVAETFQRYNDGQTMREIWDWLNEKGVKNQRGGLMTFNTIQHTALSSDSFQKGCRFSFLYPSFWKRSAMRIRGLEQQQRPLPAAETGRSCWGRVLLFQSPAKGLRKNQQTQPARPCRTVPQAISPLGCCLACGS